MKKAFIALALLLIAPSAQAQQAIAPYQMGMPLAFMPNNSTYLRAGPGANYPRIVLVYSNRYFDIHSCLSDWRWCEVTVGAGLRGWLPGDQIYLKDVGYVRQYGQRVGVPFTVFNQNEYWYAYYRNTDFYADWAHGRVKANPPAYIGNQQYYNPPKYVPLPTPRPTPAPMPPVTQVPQPQPEPVKTQLKQRMQQKQQEIRNNLTR